MGVPKMINYLYIFFLPGAAGNFFSRCMSLASDRCVGQIPFGSAHPYLSLEEKFQSFSYSDIQRDANWIEFESKLVHYSDLFEHHALVKQSVSVWHQHPDYAFLEKKIEGPNDEKYVFYIDPSDAFEWCVLNALHKDSYIQKKWMCQGKKMLEDPAIIKINLSDIFSSHVALLASIQKVCDTVGINLESTKCVKIIELWNQWIATTLPPTRFEEFKRHIGYFHT